MSSPRKDESKNLPFAKNNNHPVALLVDVDKTLLLGRDGSYNMDLINALKSTGHNQIYLFTSMTMRDIVEEMAMPEYSSRPKLVEKLQQEGIEVVKVLTPADVAYNKGIGAAYDELFLKHHKRIGSELTVENYRTDKEFNADRTLYDDCHHAAKSVAPATEKSKLYQYFILHKSQDIISSIVIDDVQEHLTAVQEIKSPGILKATGIVVKKESDQAYFEENLLVHYLKQIEQILPKMLFTEKPNISIFNCYINELTKRAHNAAEQKNYDAACRYFEIMHLISNQAKLAPAKINDLIMNINKFRSKAKSNLNKSSDNVDADILYREIMNANPIMMRIRKIQLNMDLFKYQYSGMYQSTALLFSAKNREKRDHDFQASILNPYATLIGDHPEVREMCLMLFKQIQPMISDDQYKSLSFTPAARK